MLRGLDSQNQKFLLAMDQLAERMDKAQRQVSSGKRLNTVSDAPDDVSVLLATRSELSAVVQAERNLQLVKTEVDTADQALGLSIAALDRVLSLGTQGNTDTMNAEGRRTLSIEIASILVQLANFADTQVNGRHIFAGDADHAVPYSVDLALLENPFTAGTLPEDRDALYAQNEVMLPYQGTASTREVQHPQGQRFRVAFTAQEIFDNDDPAKNVFAAVNRLRVALYLNDRETIESALGNVRSAAEHLNQMQSAYGAIQNRVAEGLEVAAKRQLALQQQLSAVEDADITAAIIELSSAKYQQEAAYAAEARRPRTSLFDYLR